MTQSGTTKQPIDLSFILIAWNSQRFLERCFNSVVAKCGEEGIRYEFLVIDNGSQDDSRAIMKRFSREYPKQFRYLSLERNGGTTFSRNIALRAARGEFLCVLDSDTEISTGCFSRLFELLETDPSIGMVVPRLLLPDGSVQHSVKPFPTFSQKLQKIPGIVLKLDVKKSDFYPDFPFEKEADVDSAISACWLFRRELLEQVGLLDEKIFYSPEDLDYCQRVHQAGYRIVYSTSLTVLHHTQQISHKKPFSKTTLNHMRGLFYYYSKHGGWLRSASHTGSRWL